MDRKITVLGFTALLCLISITLRADILGVTFLDVGEGEAIFLENGEHTALIDTGNVITGERVLNYLEDREIETLDMLVITHPHLDHMGGVFQILPHQRVSYRYDNGQPMPQNQDIYRWYQQAFRAGNYRALQQGEVLPFGKATITVLNSLQPGRNNINANSLVLMLQHGEVQLLLMGDAGLAVEEGLIREGARLRANLLKVGHHGASGSTSPDFLAAVEPDFAVISIDEHNIRGYPSPELLKRLESAGVKLLATYTNGTIRFVSDGETLRLTQ